MGKTMTENEALQMLSSRFQQIDNSLTPAQGDLVAISSAAYEKKWGIKMPESKKAILASSINSYIGVLNKQYPNSKQMIASAVEDIANVDNPLSMLFSMMSVLIPNFAYTEVYGVQPMPTKESPIFYPQLSANENRNGFVKGEALLGSQNWNAKNTYSTNKIAETAAATAYASASVTFTTANKPVLPGTFAMEITLDGIGSVMLTDDGEGALSEIDDICESGTINYATGVVAFTCTSYADVEKLDYSYRYDFAAGTDPAQAVFEWVSKSLKANPYRLRSIYDLDNFYQAKQVLDGYDIDQVLSSTLAGYINKEISGNAFDEMRERADASFAWNSTEPTGVAWALHRLKSTQTFVEAGNGIRQNVKRSGGNVVIAGTGWMNTIETFGDDVWKSQGYTEEPIGPYVAGNLLNRFKVLKNQDFPDAEAIMSYKKNETDASVMAGIFIALYATNPIALDDLRVRQGMGTQMATKKVFDNSIVRLVKTA